MGSTTVLIILIIYIILFPFLLECINKPSMKKRKHKIIDKAKCSLKKGKALVVFEGPNEGYVINYQLNDKTRHKFNGDIEEIIPNLLDDSASIVLIHVLEYVNNPDKLISEVRRVSGGDFYILNHGIDINCVRSFWDSQIKRELPEIIYNCPKNEIKWIPLDNMTKNIQKIYGKIIPKN